MTDQLSPQEKFDSILSLFMVDDITETIIVPGNHIYTRQKGNMESTPLDFEIDRPDIIEMLWIIFTERNVSQKVADEILDIIKARGHYNLSYVHGGIPIRINLSRFQSTESLQLRKLPSQTKKPSELGIPNILVEAVKSYKQGGLVVVAAPTGHGKSTTIASIVQALAFEECFNLVTLEDPVEYLYSPESKACVRQRELMFDFDSYETGIEACMRQTPDIVIIQEMTTPAIVRNVVHLMKKGCLVVTTMHTPDAVSVFPAILASVPAEEKDQVAAELREYFRWFVSQRLVRTRGGKMKALFEVLTPTPEAYGILKSAHETGNYNMVRPLLQRVGNLSFAKSFYDACMTAGDNGMDFDAARTSCPVTRLSELEELMEWTS